MRRASLGAAGLLAALPIVVLGGPPASAASVSYSVAAQAPVAQVTQDDPTAQFHPQGEGDYGYTMVTATPGGDSALASVLWPGAAAGNAGTLVALLGGPNLSALNYPVRAQAASGTSRTQDSLSAPGGTEMSASVQPSPSGDQQAVATSSLAGGGLGATGSIGSSKSSSVADFNSSTGRLSASATSSASGVDVDGVVHIGSVVSSATAVSTGGSAPQVAGQTTFSDFTIAGQQAYVDASGVHVGAPGRPASSAEEQAVDSALHSAGMEIYFTDPHTVVVGEVYYYYAASVLFFWAPPGDPNDDSFTLSLGGAAVSMTASQYSSGTDFFFPQGSATTPGGAASQLAPSVDGMAGTTLSLPAPGGAGTVEGSQPSGSALSNPMEPSPTSASGTGGPAPGYAPAGVQLPGGLGGGWWALLALAAIGGAALTTRLPRLLERGASGVCANERRRRNAAGRTR